MPASFPELVNGDDSRGKQANRPLLDFSNVFRTAWDQRQSFLIGPVYSDRRDQPELLRHQQGSPGRTAQRDGSEEAPGPVLGGRLASGAVQESRLVSLRGLVQHQADVAVVAQDQTENPARLFNACEFRLTAAPDHGQPVAGRDPVRADRDPGQIRVSTLLGLQNTVEPCLRLLSGSGVMGSGLM
jgi:hypothetical protein